MSDREEREEHIKRLEAALACEEKQSSGKCSKQTCDENCALLYEQGNWGEWKETLRYAIASIKTDLKYDLLYEETIGQADKPTTKNDLGIDATVVPFEDTISRQEAIDTIRQLYLDLASQKAVIDLLKVLPSVTSQFSSELDKNSKKLENPTTKNDLGVDWDELKRKILMEVDGGTDDAWLAYGEVCNRISNSIDEFVSDIRGEEE